MRKFIKKPVVIEAVQWKGDNLFEVISFTDGKPDLSTNMAAEKWEDYKSFVRLHGFKIKTLEGMMSASVGDWIIKGVQGEFYPCKPAIFEQTYAEVKA